MMRLYFTLRLMQLVIPWIVGIVRFMLMVIWRLLLLMWIALAATWMGVPQVIDRMVSEWSARARAIGIPVQDPGIQRIFQTTAFLAIVFGWFLDIKMVIFIVKWIVN